MNSTEFRVGDCDFNLGVYPLVLLVVGVDEVDILSLAIAAAAGAAAAAAVMAGAEDVIDRGAIADTLPTLDSILRSRSLVTAEVAAGVAEAVAGVSVLVEAVVTTGGFAADSGSD